MITTPLGCAGFEPALLFPEDELKLNALNARNTSQTEKNGKSTDTGFNNVQKIMNEQLKLEYRL